MSPKFFYPNSWLRGKECFRCFICYLFPYSYIDVKLLQIVMSIYVHSSVFTLYIDSMIVNKNTSLFTFRIFYPLFLLTHYLTNFIKFIFNV